MNDRLTLSLLVTLALTGIGSMPADAHGKPEHGGAFTEVKEYTFEVVSKEQEGEKTESAEKEKKPHQENMEFTVYVKDPALKPVTAGTGSVTVSEGDKQVAEAPLAAGGNAFKAKATLPHHGRYRLAIDFTPSGEKPLKAKVSINVD